MESPVNTERCKRFFMFNRCILILNQVAKSKEQIKVQQNRFSYAKYVGNKKI